MIVLGPATQDEVVMAFLKAEVDSPRFSKWVDKFLKENRCDRNLIDRGDLQNPDQNRLRRTVLGQYRGFGTNEYLFKNFPDDVTWTHVKFDCRDFEGLKYIDESHQPVKDQLWSQLSNGSRLVSVGATNVRKQVAGEDPRLTETKGHILAVASGLDRHVSYPDIVAVKSEDGPLVLIEGATRSTAYVLTGRTNVKAIVGSSASMGGWRWY